MKRLLVIFLVIFLLIGYFILRTREGGLRREPERPSASALTVAALRNASYRTDDCGKITLRNGAYEPADPNVRCSISLLDKVAIGDLDGDGASDAAVLLGTDFGGSGFFVSLAAVLNRGGAPEHAASLPLEDRIKIDEVRIEEGMVRLAATVHSVAAPMCCPDSAVRWRFRLDRDSLVRLPDR